MRTRNEAKGTAELTANAWEIQVKRKWKHQWWNGNFDDTHKQGTYSRVKWIVVMIRLFP